MLEDLLKQLIDAVNANTAAHGGKAPAAGKGAPAAQRPTTGTKITFDQIKAALIEVRDNHGKPAAQKIIKDAGRATEMASIKPANFAAVLAACKEAMGEGDTSEDTGDADDDTL